MLCGLLKPTARRVSEASTSEGPGGRETTDRLHVAAPRCAALTVDQNIRFFGGIYGLSGATLEKRRRSSWTWRDCTDGADKASDLAGGWRQRLALVRHPHEPQIVFLDEPTGGVDRVEASVRTLIDQLAEGGVTVLVTTHYLDEASTAIGRDHPRGTAGAWINDRTETCLRRPHDPRNRRTIRQSRRVDDG
jgi:ABC-2 type transport system ATP-binding protein